MLHWTSNKVKVLISLVSFVFFLNHFSYLAIGRFDYNYNMKANILTGEFEFLQNIDEKSIKCLFVISFRNSNRNWMGHLVFIAAQKEVLFVENFIVSSVSCDLITIRS